MIQKTDMEQVRNTAKAFLYLDVATTEYAPMIVRHPFAASGIVAVKTNKGLEMLDITESEDNLERWRRDMTVAIDRAKDPFDIFVLLNKPYRLLFLKEAREYLSVGDFSQFLSEAWVTAESPNMDTNVSKRELVSMFLSADKSSLMEPEEVQALDDMEDTVTIYRGVTSYNGKDLRAMTWTLNREMAEWFAHRFGQEGEVYAAQIEKVHILAYFSRRNEDEIIVDPKGLRDIHLDEGQGFGMNMN